MADDSNGQAQEQQQDEVASADRDEHLQDPDRMAGRFDVYVIDSGWNLPVSQALKQNLGQLRACLQDQKLYVLDQAQSAALLKRDPSLIGFDPIVLFVDRQKKEQGKRFGFRLNLGIFRHAEQALAQLQHSLRIVTDHRSAQDIARTVESEVLRIEVREAFQAIGERVLELH
jgi:hypothetical protein